MSYRESMYDIIKFVAGLRKMLNLTSWPFYLQGIKFQYPCIGGITFSYTVLTFRTVYFPSEKCVFFSTVYFTSEECIYLQNRPFTFKRTCLPSKQTFYFQKGVFTFRTQTLLHPQIHKHTFPPTVLLQGSWCPEQCFWILTINLKY
jgi:hypothetical protein